MPRINTAALFVLFFWAALAMGADDPVDQALAERKKLFESAKEDYEKKLTEIDALTIEKLSIILRKGIGSKNFKLADAAGKAIVEIQKPEKVEEAVSVSAETEAKPRINSIASASSDADFPDGTFRKFGHHYTLMPFKMTRADALKNCESFGGHLLSISDQDEYSFFLEFAKKEKKQVWLDLFRKDGAGEWLCWDGGKTAFLKWFEGKYNEDSHSDAVVMNVNNTGVDMVRVKGTKFACFVICEWEK